jgi:hypothetical protein
MNAPLVEKQCPCSVGSICRYYYHSLLEFRKAEAISSLAYVPKLRCMNAPLVEVHASVVLEVYVDIICPMSLSIILIMLY